MTCNSSFCPIVKALFLKEPFSLKTKLKLPSASIKPDNQGAKYKGGCSLENSCNKTFLFLYLLFLSSKKFEMFFSPGQFLTNSN